MELRPNLQAQAKQSIAITPRIIQSIKLLKYRHDELFAYLKEQEERNPLIEVVLPEARGAGPSDHTPGSDTMAARRAEDGTRPATDRAGGAGANTGSTAPASGDLRSIEETFASATSLREHLLRQVDLTIRGDLAKLVAVEIVESIEADGYLRRDLDEIALCLDLEEAQVETVLAQVQQFEPSGIGARSLAECLRLQLAEADELTEPMAVLLDNLDLLAKYEIGALARLCKVDQQDIAAMVRTIRLLDPRPGKQFDSDFVMPAMPDVNVTLGRDDTWQVELNSALLPRVLVNREYYSEMREATSGEEDTRFVTDCMKEASWLTRNLDQRANTLLKVATEIVKRQKAFLRHGVDHIKPLCQGDVAEALGMHRSTVCRAISGKYMMTDRGLFELKYFFSNAIQAAGGNEDFSAESIRAKIRHLIDNEGNGKVLSDDAIMAELRAEGVEIARRTVAKYREMMGIPSSSVRRRQLRAAAMETGLCPA